eukprot:666835-Pelagomonas_calceolata.AAC.2
MQIQDIEPQGGDANHCLLMSSGCLACPIGACFRFLAFEDACLNCVASMCSATAAPHCVSIAL